jgi:hypothetical protein
MVITVLVGSVVLAMVVVMYLFGLRTFGAMGNYTNMDSESRHAMDCMLREIRGSSLLVGYQNTGATRWLTVATTNFPANLITNTFTFNTDTGTVLWDHWESSSGRTETKTLLTGCDPSVWNMNFYSRVPGMNYSFTPVLTTDQTKMIELTWKLVRTNLINNFNTETMVTAQVVMRNKH